jgi:tRNA(Ile)-lysidine synthase
MLRPMQLALESLSRTRRYLVAVSGGRDSVALLHRLHALGFTKLVVCHVNHRLRGRASTADAAFVRRLAQRLGYEYESASIDVRRLARDTRTSIETAARNARHEFFADIARKHRCPRVILAHHADDQAETVLMRVLRGTSISGLSGMKAETMLRVGRATLTLLRPMLHIRRAAIDAYIAQHHIAFREDATNADPTPSRNRVRQSLLPQLSTAIGRDVAPMLTRLAISAERDDALLHQLTLDLITRASLIAADGSLVLALELRAAHPALQHRVLYYWLKSQFISDLDHDRLSAAVALITNLKPARINLSQGLQLRRKAGALRVALQSENRKATHARKVP